MVGELGEGWGQPPRAAVDVGSLMFSQEASWIGRQPVVGDEVGWIRVNQQMLNRLQGRLVWKVAGDRPLPFKTGGCQWCG